MKSLGMVEKIELIGEGAFGSVYSAIDEHGTLIALKEIKNITCGFREGELMSDLDHENIVKFIGMDSDEFKVKIGLELMKARSLRELIKSKGRISSSNAASITKQILEGLTYLHEIKGIVHRDVKSANILINEDGVAKIGDFGGSFRLNEVSSDVLSRQLRMGTPCYMAPEIIKTNECGPSSDIWALGATVLEMLTGAPPYYDCKHHSIVFYQIMTSKSGPLIPSDLDPDAKDFLKKCFELNQHDRPSARELLSYPFILRDSCQETDFSAFTSPNMSRVMTSEDSSWNAISRTIASLDTSLLSSNTFIEEINTNV